MVTWRTHLSRRLGQILRPWHSSGCRRAPRSHQMVYRETGASHRGDPRITAQGHEWDSAQWQSSCQGMGTVYMGVGGSLKEVRGRGHDVGKTQIPRRLGGCAALCWWQGDGGEVWWQERRPGPCRSTGSQQDQWLITSRESFFNFSSFIPQASPVAQMVKNLLAMQETQVRCLGRENPLEEDMATNSSILAWKIPLSEKPDRLQSIGSQRVRHNWVTNTFSLSLIGPRMNGNLCLQTFGNWEIGRGGGQLTYPLRIEARSQQWSGARNLFRKPSSAGRGNLWMGVCTWISRGQSSHSPYPSPCLLNVQTFLSTDLKKRLKRVSPYRENTLLILKVLFLFFFPTAALLQ